MIVGIEFDQVGPARDLVANRTDSFFDTGDFLRALRNGQARFKALWAVSASSDDGLCSDQQARPRHNALVNRALQSGIGEVGTLGSEIPLRSKARLERLFGADDRARRTKRQG